jgi:preprotein translocase subunit SecE
LIAGLGCLRLYQKLDAFIFVSATTKIVVQSLLPLAIFSVLALLIYWLVNRPSIADFMIAAEGELKKVSWSSRKEITASTIIVVSVMLIMSIALLLVDIGLQKFFIWIGLIPG